MLMKELEGTGSRVRSRLYNYLMAAYWTVLDHDNYRSIDPFDSVKKSYDNLTLQQLLDELHIQHPEEIKQFRCCGDGTVVELKKLLEEADN